MLDQPGDDQAGGVDRHEVSAGQEVRLGVGERLERMRTMAAQLEPVGDVPAEAGMIALIDFVSRVNGKKVRDGSATDYLVELGMQYLDLLWQGAITSGVLAIAAVPFVRSAYIRLYLSKRLYFERWTNLSRNEKLELGDSLAALSSTSQASSGRPISW